MLSHTTISFLQVKQPCTKFTWTFYIVFIHLLLHLIYFHLLALVTSLAMSIKILISLSDSDFVLFNKQLGLLDHMVTFSFWVISILFLHHVYIPNINVDGLSFLHRESQCWLSFVKTMSGISLWADVFVWLVFFLQIHVVYFYVFFGDIPI